MPHYDYMEFALDDGADVRLELAAAGEASAAVDADLPGGISGVVPVGRGARVASLATAR
ncbi:hypothetical protein ACFTY8_01815 [Streptomyces mirabilis]|uniref:hypothetical protein n=1 Tax=Streptomyces mirabilis TaxID=68239 RepID=UPI00363F0CE3